MPWRPGHRYFHFLWPPVNHQKQGYLKSVLVVDNLWPWSFHPFLLPLVTKQKQTQHKAPPPKARWTQPMEMVVAPDERALFALHWVDEKSLLKGFIHRYSPSTGGFGLFPSKRLPKQLVGESWYKYININVYNHSPLYAHFRVPLIIKNISSRTWRWYLYPFPRKNTGGLFFSFA